MCLQEITIFRRADKVRKNYQAALSHHNPSLLSDGKATAPPAGDAPTKDVEDDEKEENDDSDKWWLHVCNQYHFTQLTYFILKDFSLEAPRKGTKYDGA